MHTTIKNFKTKFDIINRYKVIENSNNITLIDKQLNKEFTLQNIDPDIYDCVTFYNYLTDEYYLLAMKYILLNRKQENDDAKKIVKELTFHSIPNFANNITIMESRKKHIYSPLFSPSYVNAKHVSIVYPVLNYLVKLNYTFKYNIHEFKTQYISTLPLLKITFQMKKKYIALYKNLFNTFEKEYKLLTMDFTDDIFIVQFKHSRAEILMDVIYSEPYLQLHSYCYDDVKAKIIKLIYNALI
jgi:hypothetical protein